MNNIPLLSIALKDYYDLETAEEIKKKMARKPYYRGVLSRKVNDDAQLYDLYLIVTDPVIAQHDVDTLFNKYIDKIDITYLTM